MTQIWLCATVKGKGAECVVYTSTLIRTPNIRAGFFTII